MPLSKDEQAKQERYRDARFANQYDSIWQSVGKCVFCDLSEKYVFFEKHGVVMTISLFAYIDGHFMILPRRHVRSTKDLTQLEWDTIREFSYIAKKLIKKVHGVEGMQFIQKDGATAQSTVNDHIHFHCVPFDAPDLMEWRYRKLKYTPLQNVTLYKQARKKIVESDLKFDEKYARPSGMRIVCDLVILNDKRQILLQERQKHLKLSPDYLTLPGGGVEDFSVPLEAELAREVREETGLTLDTRKITLLDSRLSSTVITRTDPHLKATYRANNRFLWNTYLLKDYAETALHPGDDCESLLWLDLEDALAHPRVSDGIRAVLQKVSE